MQVKRYEVANVYYKQVQGPNDNTKSTFNDIVYCIRIYTE